MERSLAKLAERTDESLRHARGHSWRIAQTSGKLALRFQFQRDEIADLRHAALARACGYAPLQLAALENADRLTDAERIELWRHPLLAEQFLARRNLSRHVQLVVRWHHEWWNGLGYPDQLVGETIPPAARILRAVETYFALRADRPYRQSFDQATARRLLAERAGFEIDPHVAIALLELLEEEPNLETAMPERFELPHLNPIVTERSATGLLPEGDE